MPGPAIDIQRDLYYLGVARSLADVVLGCLADTGMRGVARLDAAAEDLKGGHQIDAVIHASLKDKVTGLDLPATVYLESGEAHTRRDSRYTVFLDPIDGSTNCDRWVGDPAFVLAVAEGESTEVLFGDLCFGFCQGLVSGDYYYTLGGSSYYYSAFHRRVYECSCRNAGVVRLEDAVTYLNLGYGPRYAHHAIPILCAFVGRVSDLRGFDNTAIELCHIARNAAHLRIEGRQGSDGANLLAAMTILRTAGGVVRLLDGGEIEHLPIDLDRKMDFVAASNAQLADAAVSLLGEASTARASRT